jgi:L-lactate dehydrogenase complex protein LldG
MTPASDDGSPLVQRFSEELRAVGGVVEVVSHADLAGAVAAAVEGAEARTVVVGAALDAFADRVTEGLRRADVEVLEADGPDGWRDACTRADLGVTGALLGVASSGSVLVGAGPASSRLASLLPPAHLAILAVDRLVGGFEELFGTLGDHLDEASSTVLITGPSRTADIEMVLVRGVHGPRHVQVLLVEEHRRNSRKKGRPAGRASPSPTP